MTIDKDLYRKAYGFYRQWSDAKLVERAELAAKLSPAEAWQQYADLVEFSWKLCPEPSEWQIQQEMADWERYYADMKRFERWRKTRGKTA